MQNNDELLDFGRALESGGSPDLEPGGRLASRDKDKDKDKDTPHRPPPKGRSHATIAG